MARETGFLRRCSEHGRGMLSFVSIKVVAGEISAVTGEPGRAEVRRGPQGYMVSPKQLWLDRSILE